MSPREIYDNDLFYTCSLIEFIARKQLQRRSELVTALGYDEIRRIYDYADVFHCDIIDKVADEFIERNHLPQGEYDNVAACMYTIPDYWTMGEVYERLIEDVHMSKKGTDIVRTLIDIYDSWIDAVICDYNCDFYYQPRDYICECYLENQVL